MSLGEPSRGVRSTAWREGETERGLPRSAAAKQPNREKASRASSHVWSWRDYQQVRSIYTATSPAAGRKTAEKVLESLHTCPIPEVASSAGRYASGAPATLPTSTPAESPTAIPKPSTASSRRPADSPTASAASPITGSGSCSPQTAPARTSVRRPRLDQPNDPTQADLRRAASSTRSCQPVRGYCPGFPRPTRSSMLTTDRWLRPAARPRPRIPRGWTGSPGIPRPDDPRARLRTQLAHGASA